MDIVRDGFVKPHLNSIGYDMPPSPVEEMASEFTTFMSCNFRVPLLNRSINEIYKDFKKFKSFEQHIHPRKDFIDHGKTYDPIYTRIEIAYMENDELKFKEGVMDLVDLILHD